MIRFTLAALAGLVLLVGCGSAKVHQQLHQDAANPQVKHDQAQAEKIIQACARKSNLFSHAGRQAFIRCIAPAGKEVQVERCAQAKFASDGVLSRRARRKLAQDLTECIL